MKIIKCIFLSILVITCSLSCKRTKVSAHINETKDYYKDIVLTQDTLKSKKSNKIIPIDTNSLGIFWNDFKRDLKNDNKAQVIKSFDFPIRAIYPVIFKYAHDCDTLAYVRYEEKYNDFDITESNILEYYNFVFTDELKEVIYQTSLDDLLTNGYRNTVVTGITYSFFPKKYNIKVNCPNDHNLKFYFLYKDNRWKISVGGI